MSALSRDTIERARRWADRPPAAAPDLSPLALAEPGSGADAAPHARAWLTAGLVALAAVAVLGLAMARREAPQPRAAARPASVQVPLRQSEPALPSTVVVVQLSSGTRLYVALGRS